MDAAHHVAAVSRAAGAAPEHRHSAATTVGSVSATGRRRARCQAGAAHDTAGFPAAPRGAEATSSSIS
ncbi:hypothetical protein [Streptomyces mirabilis]|uniref:hypothetical protein n=1 Tax=Streptomyces mirabilis TaxID=68239 RepID=UPI00332D9FD6